MSEDYAYGAALFVAVLVVVWGALSIVEAARARWARWMAERTGDPGREASGRMRVALVAAAALALSAGLVQIAASLLMGYARALGSTSPQDLRLSEIAAYAVGGLSIAGALAALAAFRLARSIVVVVIVLSVPFHLAEITGAAGAEEARWLLLWAFVHVGALALLLRNTPARAPRHTAADGAGPR
jgi:ribose/xylose/arabinose/galactoside ABC-type transport system permease subunit